MYCPLHHLSQVYSICMIVWGFPGGASGKEPACQRRRPKRPRDDPLEEGMATHSSILAWRIPMARGAWRAAVHRVAKSRTQLKRPSMHMIVRWEAPWGLNCVWFCSPSYEHYWAWLALNELLGNIVLVEWRVVLFVICIQTASSFQVAYKNKGIVHFYICFEGHRYYLVVSFPI